MKTAVATSVQFTLRDDGILEIDRLPDGETTADMVPDQVTTVRQLIGDVPRPVLWKPRSKPFSDAGAWRRWIEVAPSVAVAVGVVHDEQRDGPLPPFVAAIDSLLLPVATFTDEAEAVEFLSAFLDSPG